MTYDEGPAKIYSTKNTAESGDMPVAGRVLLSEEYYGNRTVGINRYYTAMTNGEKIDKLIEIWPIAKLDTSCIFIIAGEEYAIRQIQDATNEDGLKIQIIALERNANDDE